MAPARAPSNHATVQEALNKKILKVFQRLPTNQRKVAEYILQQPSELAFQSTDTLARRLHVSKPTVVRFAQSLGYEGFTELQRECLGALHADLANVNRLLGRLKHETHAGTLRKVAEAEMANIDETLKHIDKQTFDDVVRLLARARRVYTMGVGVSSLLSQLMAYELNQVIVDARSIATGPMRFVETLASACSNDVVVGFSFPPYSRETVDAATFANGRGIPVVAFTDTRTSPITFQAARVITVRTQNMLYTNSISAVSIITNAIVTQIALQTKRRMTPVLKSVAQVMKETGQYIE
ncbi:MAG TPA: MurR/RpiR family transcriptional regulator [Bacteroidota bacterium]|nr:MurR/RpiR family transcriptional regulator [Bacteroidota bacterium]